MGLYQERVIDPRIRACYNATGSTILKGSIMKLVAAATTPGQVQLAAAATDPFIGVAMADIPNLQFGDMQTDGVAVVLAGATVAVGANVTSDGSGKGTTAASGNAIIGVAQTDGVNNGYMEVALGLPGAEANN
jgi:hypothetical protein